MALVVDQIKLQAQSLSSEERAELAQFFLESLEENDADIREAWRVEISRRAAEVRDGTAIGRPVEEVIAELRNRDA